MKNKHSRRQLALAVAAACLGLANPAGSAVVVTGPYFTHPGGAVLANGAHLALPSTEVWLAAGANGSFSATAGSQVDLGSFYLGNGGTGLGALDGAGTVMRLNSAGHLARLTLGATSQGALTVSGGALLDGRHQAGNCLSGHRFCGSFIGDAAGSTGTLAVTGAGSEARLLGALNLANGYIDPNGNYGVAGGVTSGTVRVEAGGLLRSQDVHAGSGWVPPGANGNEKNFATAVVDGAGSQWLVGNNTVNGNEAAANFAQGPKATASLTVSNGGRFELQSDAGRNYGLRLGQGGSFSGSVTGADSVLWMSGDASQGYFHLAENGGTAQLDVSNGGRIGGARWVQLGLNGGHATLNLSGGTADFSRAEVTAGNGAAGTIIVSGGGRLDTRQLNLATTQQTSSGTVSVDGAGSLITLGGVDTHRLSIGGSGVGALTVGGGALLDASVDAAACAGRWCGAFVGQLAGSTARLTVTGAGSEARFLSDFNVGEVFVGRPAHEGWTGGEINGTTRARVEVLAGGSLVTERVRTGGAVSASQGGGERSFVELLVDGAGSRWRVTGNATQDAQFTLSENPARAVQTQLDIRDGGLLQVQAQPGRQAGVDLASGGSSVTTVQGTGSRVEITGDTSRFVVGNTVGGSAELTVKDGGAVVQNGSSWSYLNIGESRSVGRVEILSGGQVSGARAVNVGSGGQGSLLIGGAGSLLTTDRNGSFVGQLNVGNQGHGWLDVWDGGRASAFSLQVGSGSDPTANRGEVWIDGAGTRVEMDAVDWHRMAINNGAVQVSGGALLDGTLNAAACVGRWCGVFIANNAGDTAKLTVTGSGSTARFLSNFNVGQAYVTAPPATPYVLGEPGGTSTAQVHVLDGGRLETQQVSIANGSSGPAANGSESVIAQLRIKGAGSVWAVTGGNGSAASFSSGLGQAANTLTDIQIADGGQLLLAADANTAAFVQLGSSGGVNRMSISGAGAKLAYGTTSNAGFWVGRNGATASLAVANGGAIEGINRLQVGNTGATGTLSVVGAASRIDYGHAFADLYVGRQGGTGSAALTQGGVVSMEAWLPRLYVGSGDGAAGTSGALRIDGAGSLLSLVSPISAAGAFDLPQANIGWGGIGSVDVTAGGQLLVNGRGTSTPTQIAQTRMTIGQFINGLNGTGTVNVSGAGSRLAVAGTDATVYVGRLAGGTGALNLSHGALLQTTLLDVGLQGGSGALQMNAATLDLGGQHAGSHIGATLGIGLGTGSLGSVSVANGSSIHISNAGSEGALLLVGGANSAPGGNGSLVVRGSSVQISGPADVTGAIFGYNGSGQGSFENGSTLDLGPTGGVVVAWKPASNGLLQLSGGSALTAAYVGVGASREGDGGVARLIVNDTSSVTASTIEIGAKGYVGGTGTLIGDIVNRGIFNPGNSPGTLHLHGSFANQAGGRLVLEIESDGHGGFLTDQLVFGAGGAVSLGSVQIEFRFLGTTDPNAFQASGGFQIDSFLRQGGAGLDHSLLGAASYSASSAAYQFNSFSFSAEGGAVFQAQAVPEPQAWAMLLAGLFGVSWITRRRGHGFQDRAVSKRY